MQQRCDRTHLVFAECNTVKLYDMCVTISTKEIMLKFTVTYKYFPSINLCFNYVTF